MHGRRTRRSTRVRRAATLAALFTVIAAAGVAPFGPRLLCPPAQAQDTPKRGVKTPQRDQDGRRLLRKMLFAETRQAFIAREASFRADGPGTEQWVKRDPKRGLRRESIRPPGDLLVDNYENSWFVSPNRKRFVERPSMLRRMLSRGKETIGRVDRGALRVHLIGEDRVAGRDADIIGVAPPEGVRAPSHRFWVDRETGLRLKTEERDPEGRVVSGSYYISLDLKPKFSDSDFAPPTPPHGARVVREKRRSFRRLEEAAKAGFTVRAPSFVPNGFKLRTIEVFGDGERIALRYGNDLDALSLVQTRAPLRALVSPHQQKRMKGDRTGFFPFPRGQRAYVWHDKGTTFMLFGSLPDEELKRIADSVK